MTLLEQVAQHYVSMLGEPSRNARFQVDAYAAEVFKWDANDWLVAFYATIGCSREPVTGHDATHRLEFFIGLRPEQDDVARTLAMVAVESALNGTPLGDGHTLTFSEPIWPGTEMKSFLVLRPRVEMIPALVAPDGVHVEFLQLVPLFASELEFKRLHGVEALLAGFEHDCVVLDDPTREAWIV